jgi:hypothetical protein
MHMAQAGSIHHKSDVALSMTRLLSLRINTGIPLTFLEERFRDRAHI